MSLAREEGGGDLQRRFAEALVAHQRGARPAAEAGYRQVLERRADFADAWNNLGVLLNEAGRHEEALACFRHLAELEPAKPRSHANLGVALRALGRGDEAKASYLAAVSLDPAFHSAQNNLGNLHYAVGEFAEAVGCFDAAAKLAPAMPEYRFMLAKSLVECRRLDRAEAELRFVIQCDPAHADAWGILGRVWSERHCLKEALGCFDQGLAVRPTYDGLRYNRGLARLLDGDLAGGFADYERRFEVADFPSKRLAVAQPLWDGRELPEQTLLLHAEQGLGDTLQFLRYLPDVARRARRVLLVIQEVLTPLALLPANVELVHEGEKLPAFDWVCPLLSLPHLLGTTLATVPGNIPYLRTEAPSAVDWASRITGRGLRVGLVWAGNPSHQNDAKRSLALARLQSLFEIPGIDYYALQVGERRREIAESGLAERLPDLGAACGSFADTAEALRELDLLICVDTSIAHLAGGLGLPVWLLLPWMPDWRWLLEREESPWYPSLRLFRQTAVGDWDGVVERLGQALAALAEPTSAAGQASLRSAQLLVEEGREELERSGAALAAPLFWRALREYPRLARAASALAVLAYRAGNAPAAVQFGWRACRLEAGDPENWSNCGAYFKAAGQLAGALACFERGLAVGPDYPGLTYNRGLARLLDGDLAGGFADYERRFEVADFPSKRMAVVQPLWDGRELPEQTLLLHAEQGLGDTLQFLRYLPDVARRAQRVLLLIQETLTPLALLPANVELVHEGEQLPAFDWVCPLLSLPHLLGTTLATIPGNIPYLRTDVRSAVDWVPRIGGRGLRVGLVWAGNPSHQNDANRSLVLSRLLSLLDIPGIDYYALQVGDRRRDIADAGLAERLPDLGAACGSFADTAAALRELDLLICVDTSIAHLAGGLGLPVWLLLPWMPDWRWLLQREDSPWYPSLRLFRQTAAGDWEGVVERLRQALAALADPASAAGRESLRAAQLLVEDGRGILESSGAALAAPLFWRALRDYPQLARAASALAVLAYRVGNVPAAVQFGRRACRQEPRDPENWSNCGAFLKAVGHFDEALACQRQALTLAPESAAVHANLGNILGKLGDWDGAERAARTAVALAPENPEFLFSLGVALREQAAFAEALGVFRRTQSLAGGHIKAALHEALIELLLGDLAVGWAHYESRWQQPDCKERRAFNRPCWQGEPLAGKRILLHAEQGFGDSFQFLRYVPLVAALGAQVILVVQPELESIAARMGGCSTLIRSGEPLPDFDYHCPLLSLPRAFATDLATIPAAVPYISPLPERLAAWEARLPKRRGYRVGLVWAGRPSHGNDANRSMRLAMFDELLAIPGIEWFSLQKGPAVEQLGAGSIIDLSSDLASFEDTAAVLAQLDELVTVDTSVAHLAGALGLPVRVLLPRVPDWRWLWERKDSPWYPSARLYRQTTRGDWSAPLAELAADLRLAAQK